MDRLPAEEEVHESMAPRERGAGELRFLLLKFSVPLIGLISDLLRRPKTLPVPPIRLSLLGFGIRHDDACRTQE